MNLLICTNKFQGKRKNDFCWTNEGELAIFGIECSREKIDGSCGCRRSMVGIDSRKATTTVQVAEVDIDHDGLKQRIRTSEIKAGFGEPSEENLELMALAVEQEADQWTTGTILERREIFQVRSRF
jgi:hypothetical protein